LGFEIQTPPGVVEVFASGKLFIREKEGGIPFTEFLAE
jgi:hypothetical protein